MHKNYIKKLLKIQDKNIILDEKLTNISLLFRVAT